MISLTRTSARTNQQVSIGASRSWLYLPLLCAITLILATPSIKDEAMISLRPEASDMANYMMNAAFFYDLINDLPLQNIIKYPYQYYAQYPALTLGHHPILPSLALVPFFYIFGISVFSSRLATVFFMLFGCIMLFKLVKLIYDEKVAFLSSLLFITTPFIVKFSRVATSEIPTLSLIITTAYFFLKYCETENRKYLRGVVIFSVLSVYAKHTAIFTFPFYLIYYVINKGLKICFSKDNVTASLIIMILILPLVPLTLKFSQYNVSYSKTIISSHYTWINFSYLLDWLYSYHLTPPVLFLSLTSIAISLYRRKRKELTVILWILLFYLLSVYTSAPTPRHIIYWIPAFCLLATALVNAFNHHVWKVFITTVIILISGYQFAIAYNAPAEFAYGYEEAAEFICSMSQGDVILYSQSADPGYFIFFVRKFDQDRNMIVLRANKILATSENSKIIDDKIHSRSEIYDILNNFRVRYIVIEERKFKSPALELLGKEVKSEHFSLIRRIPVRSNYPALKGAQLAIYEYNEHSDARDDVMLQMQIPLMGDSIIVKFSDLLKSNNR